MIDQYYKWDSKTRNVNLIKRQNRFQIIGSANFKNFEFMFSKMTETKFESC